MIEPGAVLDVAKLGVKLEVRRTSRETGGQLVEFDVVGRARGFLTGPHVHERQVERHEVIEGSMRIVIAGTERLLVTGDVIEVPVGAVHRQLPTGDGDGRVRVQLRPAGRAEEFLERIAQLSRDGDLNRWGYPSPLAAAALVTDFGDESHASWPPMRVQRELARRLQQLFSREYVFVDEWDVAAPRDVVFEAIADARTYPQWWRPVYIDVQAEGEPAVGKVSLQHFKGRLPYHLHTRSTIVRLDPPHVVAGDVDGDLRGHGIWTLTETAGGTHVRFDWRVDADRRLLRMLTPVLRPALRSNHAWAIQRAMEGLEPYARRRAAERAAA
jgi:mannose-6-phosphate isomerase-like protein (cupin superfamily)/uncharacterized protein YndB with AHSA1/START domain